MKIEREVKNNRIQKKNHLDVVYSISRATSRDSPTQADDLAWKMEDGSWKPRKTAPLKGLNGRDWMKGGGGGGGGGEFPNWELGVKTVQLSNSVELSSRAR